MTTKIDKVLAKLDKKRQAVILQIIKDIYTNTREQYDHSPIQGKEYVYRIRKGKIRIVFSVGETGNQIINVGFRGNVYKDL